MRLIANIVPCEWSSSFIWARKTFFQTFVGKQCYPSESAVIKHPLSAELSVRLWENFLDNLVFLWKRRIGQSFRSSQALYFLSQNYPEQYRCITRQFRKRRLWGRIVCFPGVNSGELHFHCYWNLKSYSFAWVAWLKSHLMSWLHGGCQRDERRKLFYLWKHALVS